MSNQILNQVQNLSLDEKRELLGLLDELEDAKSREKCATDYMAFVKENRISFALSRYRNSNYGYCAPRFSKRST